ncbi:hypothetical protein DFH09DRAFT_914172 [Mycena vulgaris]|nr:hypothetical protein DFH09DRAFT_914172 [Mycena vulgaris]
MVWIADICVDHSSLTFLSFRCGAPIFGRHSLVVLTGSRSPSKPSHNCDQWRASILQRNSTESLHKAIINVLCEADEPAAGVRAHLANSILCHFAIHPDTPTNTLCLNEQLYSCFRDFFPLFMALWVSAEFKKCCGGRPSSVNPFAFNYTSDMNFRATWVQVFQKEKVRVPQDLYNWYQSLGHFDESNHCGVYFIQRTSIKQG